MSYEVTPLPTTAELIRDCGKQIGSSSCSCCGQWSLFRIGEWLACLVCDTTGESRRAANLADRP